MARNISVKIPTSTLIAQIESAIAEIDEAAANYPALLEKYERDSEAYKTKVAEFISDYLSKNAGRVGYEHDSVIRVSGSAYSYNRFELTFQIDSIPNFPERPVRPEQPDSSRTYGREYTTKRSILERNLKILRMTSQEEVNASTYGAIMEIL
jgi:hypothetical protein